MVSPTPIIVGEREKIRREVIGDLCRRVFQGKWEEGRECELSYDTIPNNVLREILEVEKPKVYFFSEEETCIVDKENLEEFVERAADDLVQKEYRLMELKESGGKIIAEVKPSTYVAPLIAERMREKRDPKGYGKILKKWLEAPEIGKKVIEVKGRLRRGEYVEIEKDELGALGDYVERVIREGGEIFQEERVGGLRNVLKRCRAGKMRKNVEKALKRIAKEIGKPYAVILRGDELEKVVLLKDYEGYKKWLGEKENELENRRIITVTPYALGDWLEEKYFHSRKRRVARAIGRGLKAAGRGIKAGGKKAGVGIYRGACKLYQWLKQKMLAPVSVEDAIEKVRVKEWQDELKRIYREGSAEDAKKFVKNIAKEYAELLKSMKYDEWEDGKKMVEILENSENPYEIKRAVDLVATQRRAGYMPGAGGTAVLAGYALPLLFGPFGVALMFPFMAMGAMGGYALKKWYDWRKAGDFEKAIGAGVDVYRALAIREREEAQG